MWWLVGTVVLTVAPSTAMPSTGLDHGWVAALNIAGSYHLRFGTDLVFTYGPLGFLDDPLATRPQVALLAFIFQATVAASLWISIRAAAQHVLRDRWACVLASATTVLVFSTVPASTALLAAALYFGTEYVRTSRCNGGLTPACPYALSVGAALLLLIKSSDGLALLGFAAMTAAFGPPRHWWRRCGLVIAAFVATALACWLWSQHSFEGLARWLAGSARFNLGYTDAMAKGYEGDAQALTAAVVLAALLGFLTMRSTPWRTGHLRSAIGSALLLSGGVLYGLKAGFVRSDDSHRAQYFVVLIPLAIRLVSDLPVRSRYIRKVAPASVAATLVLVVGPAVGQLNVIADLRTSAAGARAAFDSAYRTRLEQAARTADRRDYAVPHRMLAEIGASPVAIDPWEVTVAWAYHLRWRPAPVFQTYASYTPAFDRAEARFLLDAPDNQYVLRQRRKGGRANADGGSSEQTTLAAPTIDGRNPAWDSPRYQLTLYCNYDPVDSSSLWMLFRKGADRCGRPRAIETVHAAAFQRIAVPTAASNQIVVLSYHGASDLPMRIETFLLRPTHHLHASCDDSRFRLPEGMADGPLIVAGGGVNAESVTTCSSVSFSSAGSVTFSAVPLR